MIMVSEAAENNMDNRMKDLLPEKISTLYIFFISVPIVECVQPKTSKFKSKMDFLIS